MDREALEAQLQRQVIWLKESWLWHLQRKVTNAYKVRGTGQPPPRGLDVGCGPGLVMDLLGAEMDIEGVDLDPDMVEMCRARGLRARTADAGNLPFDDGEFDIVYCSFLLLWVKDPVKVVNEMTRVSRRWVIALAEPDYGARIDHPGELRILNDIMTEGILAEGGDPHIGRKLRHVFSSCGLDVEVGAHAGVWDVEKLRGEFDGEWRSVKELAKERMSEEELERVRGAWSASIEDGTVFQYNPIFFAFGQR